MRSKQKACPTCGGEMHRQSRQCFKCSSRDPKKRAKQSESRKGKRTYEMTDETRRRMSLAQKGKPKPSLLGRKRPGHSAFMKEWWTPQKREIARQRGLLNAENYEWMLKIAEAVINGKTGKGKNGKRVYSAGWGDRWRQRIRKRANGKCEQCGKTPEYPLDLHHKDFGTTDHTPENLMVICRSCHKLFHFANSRRTKARSSSVSSGLSSIRLDVDGDEA